jgi:hypothetical protein
MFVRINILKIIRDHFKTLRTYNSESKFLSIGDTILFLIIPLIISCILIYKNYNFEEQLSNLIAGISIFGGFLFNLLAIIYSQMENIEKNNEGTEDENLQKLKKKFIDEIHINISFCIVLSIIVILSLFLTTIDFPIQRLNLVFQKIITGLTYFLLILFLLSLLMVVNRVYILLKRND